MSTLFDHATAAILAAVIALPVLLVTVVVLVVALISVCARSPERRVHTRELIGDLTEFTRALRSSRIAQDQRTET